MKRFSVLLMTVGIALTTLLGLMWLCSRPDVARADPDVYRSASTGDDANDCITVAPSHRTMRAAVGGATGAEHYTAGNGKLQDDHVNDVFIYDTTGEQSSTALGVEANWVHGVAKTTGDPTVTPASNITLSGTQTFISHSIRISITIGGETGVAKYCVSLNGGQAYSVTPKTTTDTWQSLMACSTDTGLDIKFDASASWTLGDEFTIASWWGEGESSTRSATQDFPEKVAIIVTDSGVEIIDLTDDTVWMRFVSSHPASQADQQNLVADAVEAVCALNGKTYLGGEDGFMSGVAVIDLMADRAQFYDAGGVDWDGWDYLNNIAQRNDAEEDGPGGAGWYKIFGYPRLSYLNVYDVSAAVVETSTYLAIGTKAENGSDDGTVDLLVDFTTVYSHDTGASVEAVALVGDDLYYADGVNLYAKYDVGELTDDWTSANVTYTIGTTPALISNAVNALTGWAGASTAHSGDNRLYVGTDGGLTILEEHQGQEISGTALHYGHTGSTNAALDYKVLVGATDVVSDVDFAAGHTVVYVATNDGAEGGGVSVLRPYVNSGDVPYLYEYYRTDTTPALLSNDVTALSHGSDLLVGTAISGATRLLGVPPLTCPVPITGVNIGGPTAGISGTPYTFTATVYPADATEPITYTWAPEPLTGQYSDSVQYRWSLTGPQVITVTAENCGGVVSDTHDITVTQTCQQPAGFGFDWSPDSPQTGETVRFTATVGSGTPPFTYTWDFGDEESSQGQHVAHTYTQSDTYTVGLTVTNSCGWDAISHTLTVTEMPFVLTYGVELTPTARSGKADSGETLVYTHTLRNTGDAGDTYTVIVTSPCRLSTTNRSA